MNTAEFVIIDAGFATNFRVFQPEASASLLVGLSGIFPLDTELKSTKHKPTVNSWWNEFQRRNEIRFIFQVFKTPVLCSCSSVSIVCAELSSILNKDTVVI